MRDEAKDTLARLLERHCSPEVVRAAEAGRGHTDLWQAIEGSGYLDALVPTDKDGVGLSVRDAGPLVALCGQFAVPVPLAETLIARALLAAGDMAAPAGTIGLAMAQRTAEGTFAMAEAPGTSTPDWSLAEVGAGRYALLDARRAKQSGPETPPFWHDSDIGVTFRFEGQVRLLLAATRSQQISGAMATVFAKTLAHANDRVQFGKSIGKFQAIQHQLGVMAETLFATQMIADVAWDRDDLLFDSNQVAAAKGYASEAAAQIANMAHAIHGAIGFAEELDLQLFTRRLHTWRRSAGSEAYWYTRLGEQAARSTGPTLDLLLQLTGAQG